MIDDNPDCHPFVYTAKAGLGDSLEVCRKNLTQEHYNNVKTFQDNHADGNHVVYSSEHLHSRVYDAAAIHELKKWLTPLYDQIKIIVYLRRQDRLVLSAYSTHLRGGETKEFRFPPAGIQSPYFGYRKMVNQWAEVFGKSNVNIRLFEKQKLYKESIVDDFGEQIGFDMSDTSFVQPIDSNKSLSHAAKLCLIQINREIARQTTTKTKESNWPTIKEDFLKFVESNTSTADKDTDLTTRSDAEAFYQRFADDNERLFNDFQLNQSFSSDFTIYPDSDNAAISQLLANEKQITEATNSTPTAENIATLRTQANRLVKQFVNTSSADNQVLLNRLKLA